MNKRTFKLVLDEKEYDSLASLIESNLEDLSSLELHEHVLSTQEIADLERLQDKMLRLLPND